MLSRVGGQTENSIKSAAESLNRNSFNWGIEKMYMGLIKGKWEEIEKESCVVKYHRD